MQHLSYKPGFTLIETVIVVGILSIVGTVLTVMIVSFYRTNSYIIQEGTAVQSSQRGLSQSLQDLREASYGDDGSYPIANAATSTVTFYADVNNSSSVQKVRLYLSNGTLYRGVTYSSGSPPAYSGAESTSVVATYVTNSTSTPIFQYYDNTGALLASPVNVAQIASINTTLTIDVDPHRSPIPYTVTGSATLRNLR